MRWFRHRPQVASLALVALAVQCLLSAGHVHGALPLLRTHDVSFARDPLAASTPDKPFPAHHSGAADCLICWTASLAGSAVLGAMLLVSWPNFRSEPLRLSRVLAFTRPEAASSFRARAPPRSASV